ncbi:hypothetical protein GSI_09861 [Ganoderma sinense ZZ0214-1]|uniref:Uncharacterized protein n=1 Tax=Ganoderma sinense ZZ0214-1 TaxID=1077348 RepID=A0A2G8S2L2_9APHY|nr:hypothetical protein GSI_09861 [Ganoderma sinense ZZ0214-1]
MAEGSESERPRSLNENQNEKDQFSKLFYGLYRHAFEVAEFGPYWMRSPSTDAFQITEDVTAATSGNADSPEEQPVPLFYGPHTESLEVLADPTLVDDSDDAVTHALEVSHSHSSLVGHWSGSYTYDGISWGGDGLVSFSIEAHREDGSVSGSGTDVFGSFTVKGTLEGDRSTFSSVECKEQVEERPFWYCIDCQEPTFMCYECNRRVEKDKPWLVQWRANTDYHNTHDWSHTLVSVPDPDVGGEAGGEESGSSNEMEERLARLEMKLDKQSVDLGSRRRLATLEKLLERLLNGAP